MNKPGNPTSLSLLQQVRAKDDQAWERFIQIYTPLVRFWCIRKSGLSDEEAADIIQEVFLSVSRAIATFERDESGGSLRGWLRVITQNKVRNLIQRQRKHPRPSGGTTAAGRLQSLPDPVIEEDEHAESGIIMKRALGLMKDEFTETTYQAFLMSAVDGLSTDQIGEKLGLSTQAVRQACYRVRRRLRVELADVLE